MNKQQLNIMDMKQNENSVISRRMLVLMILSGILGNDLKAARLENEAKLHFCDINQVSSTHSCRYVLQMQIATKIRGKSRWIIDNWDKEYSLLSISQYE